MASRSSSRFNSLCPPDASLNSRLNLKLVTESVQPANYRRLSDAKHAKPAYLIQSDRQISPRFAEFSSQFRESFSDIWSTMKITNTDIDAVYTWVNNSDPAWQSLYKKVGNRRPQDMHCSAAASSRFKDRGELIHSVRSLKKYAPWVRKIFLVSNCSFPQWAVDDEQITCISHETIFPDLDCLPTFNSHAIEACIHLIPGLSEHFIYLNDDVFIMQPVAKVDFFPEPGHINIFVTSHPIPDASQANLRPAEHAMLRTCELLVERFEFKPELKLHHAPFPLLKKTMQRMESDFNHQVAATRRNKFRSPIDLPMATTLHAYYCAAKGRATKAAVRARYVDIGNWLFLLLVGPGSPLRRGKYRFLCLNEVEPIRILPGLRDLIIARLLNKLFPQQMEN